MSNLQYREHAGDGSVDPRVLDQLEHELNNSNRVDGRLGSNPGELRGLLSEVLAVLKREGMLMPQSDEISPQTAAEMLGVSRPTVYKLLDKGVLPSRDVGSHRRVRTSDVVEYRTQLDASRRVLAETFGRAAASEQQLLDQY